MEVLKIIAGLLAAGTAFGGAMLWWCEKPERDWVKTLKPVAEPDPLVGLQEVHRLELQDWDFAFQCATGKEAFPTTFPGKLTIVQGCYDPVVNAIGGLRTRQFIDEQLIRNENYVERQRRQAQQAQGMMNMLGGLGNPFR